jgi:hypothetical protein
MKYKVDGRTYAAATAAELVQMLHADCHHQEADDEAWIKDQAEHAADQFGKPIRSDNAENFIEDLIAIGYIKVIPGGEGGTD